MLGGLDYHSIASHVRRALWSLLGASSTDGYVAVKATDAAAGAVFMPPALGYNIVGGYLDWTVAGNVLTVAVKTWAGNDPSAAEPVFIPFRSDTAATGSLTYRKLTAATSIAINDTALLGTANSIAFRLWCVAFDDGGTIRLGIINCATTLASPGSGRYVTSIFPLKGWGIASSTLEDNASDSAQIFYTNGAAVAAKAYATLGYATWEAGLAAAGTWSAAPTRKQLFGPGVPLPGDLVQSHQAITGNVATGTTTIPADDTIPQITEGDQYASQAITPTSAANVLDISAQVEIASDTATQVMVAALFQDATANALGVSVLSTSPTSHQPSALPLQHRMLAGTTAATTLKLRAGRQGAGTNTLNGSNTARLYGGLLTTWLTVSEVMA